MLRVLETILLSVCVAGIIIFSYWLGQEAYSWMPVQATTDAKRVDDLFSLLVTMSSIIFLGVVGMQVLSMLLFRAKEGDYSEGHPSRGNRKLEVLWTGLPILLVLAIASYSFNTYKQMDILGPTQVLAHMHMPMGVESAEAATVNNDTKPVETIQVVAKQWAWTFAYPNNVTSNELHLPVNQRINLVLRSEDVLHGFYVPEFRVKQDIIPPRMINFAFTPIRVGKYQLQDSQFSGTYFAVMQADVYVESPEDYAKWLTKAASQKPAKATNQAASEHAQLSKRVIKSNWHTVLPAEPPVVNHSS